MTADKLEEIRVRLCVRGNAIHSTLIDNTCKHAKPLAVKCSACTHQTLSYTPSARKQSDTKFHHVEALQLSFKNILQIENLTGFDRLTKLQVFLPVPSALKGDLRVFLPVPSALKGDLSISVKHISVAGRFRKAACPGVDISA